MSHRPSPATPGSTDPDAIEELFRDTLADGRLSRAEKRALGEVLSDLDLSREDRARHLGSAFRLAREALGRVPPDRALEWLLGMSKLVLGAGPKLPRSELAQVLFEPGDQVPPHLISLVDSCRKCLDICVFTITDNRISSPILAAHRRGVRVRIVTDSDKATDPGSDVRMLAEQGIEVRYDFLPSHMHHKFAVFDGRILVTGSYNWTRGAAENNYENLLITDDRRFVYPFVEELERLWQQLEP
ncbi:MAG: phospholipase D-like domain-containing protein [Holophagales bacterium]|nr:phospholipase D-like domain-containing protein [Holophagales bacterium]